MLSVFYIWGFLEMCPILSNRGFVLLHLKMSCEFLMFSHGILQWLFSKLYIVHFSTEKICDLFSSAFLHMIYFPLNFFFFLPSLGYNQIHPEVLTNKTACVGPFDFLTSLSAHVSDNPFSSESSRSTMSNILDIRVWSWCSHLSISLTSIFQSVCKTQASF